MPKTNAPQTSVYIRDLDPDVRRRAEAEAARLRKEAEELAAKAETPEDIVEVERLAEKAQDAEAPVHARSEHGQVAHQRKRKIWRVTDKAKIPKAYWILDEAAINSAWAKNIPIPGIEYDTETSTVTRS